MLGLWLVQLVTKFDDLMGDVQTQARIGVGVVYMVLAIIIVCRNRRAVRPLLRDGFRTPYDELALATPDAEPVPV